MHACTCTLGARCPRAVAPRRANPVSTVRLETGRTYLAGLVIPFPLSAAPVDSIASAVGPELTRQGFSGVGLWSTAGAPAQWRRSGPHTHVLLATYAGVTQDVATSSLPVTVEWVEDVTAQATQPGGGTVPPLPGAPPGTLPGATPPPNDDPDTLLWTGAALLVVLGVVLMERGR